MSKDQLKLSEDVGVMEYRDTVIVGNIRSDGRWIRLPKNVFEYIKELIFMPDMLKHINSFEKTEQIFL